MRRPRVDGPPMKRGGFRMNMLKPELITTVVMAIWVLRFNIHMLNGIYVLLLEKPGYLQILPLVL